jgi:hypothetical protein
VSTRAGVLAGVKTKAVIEALWRQGRSPCAVGSRERLTYPSAAVPLPKVGRGSKARPRLAFVRARSQRCRCSGDGLVSSIHTAVRGMCC